MQNSYLDSFTLYTNILPHPCFPLSEWLHYSCKSSRDKVYQKKVIFFWEVVPQRDDTKKGYVFGREHVVSGCFSLWLTELNMQIVPTLGTSQLFSSKIKKSCGHFFPSCFNAATYHLVFYKGKISCSVSTFPTTDTHMLVPIGNTGKP